MENLDEKITEFIAAPEGEVELVGEKKEINTIAKVSPRHEQIINWLIANPHRPNRDCAAFFGVTQAWLSTIKRSDAFQARLNQRLNEMAEDTRSEYLAQLNIGLMHKLQTAAEMAVDRLTERLENATDPEFLLDCTDKLLHRSGFAPKSTPIAPVAQSSTTNNTTFNLMVSAGPLAEARLLMQNVKALPEPSEKVIED